MRRYARLIRPTVYGRSVDRIRRSRRIRQSCAMPDATLCASYQAYGLRAKCRPDKAFTPHPAVVLLSTHIQFIGVVGNMLANKTGDKIIAVIITLVITD